MSGRNYVGRQELSRTSRLVTIALTAALVGAIAALPAGSPVRDRAVLHSRVPVTLAEELLPGQWADQALHALRVKAARLAARERAERRRELAEQERETQMAAERAQRANQGTVSTASEVTAPVPGASGSPQEIAAGMLGAYGWTGSQFGCLVSLWNAESGWNLRAANPSSGAYGIPQALPGSKMASAGPDWMNDAATQIRWGLSYIQATYGSPCGAWGHEEASGWY